MARRGWTRPDIPGQRILDLVVAIVGIAICVGFVRSTVSDTRSILIWSIVLSFYFLFYRRVAQVAYWSADTYREFRRELSDRAKSLDVNSVAGRKPETTPLFHILIASYEAGDSLPPVLRAIANLDYPRDRVHAWVITERRERLTADERRRALASAVHDSRRSWTEVDSPTELLSLEWIATSRGIARFADWVDAVVQGELAPLLSAEQAPTLLMQDMLLRLLRSGGTEEQRPALDALRLSAQEQRVIETSLASIRERSQHISRDFERLLGGHGVYPDADIESKLVAGIASKSRLSRMARVLCKRWARPPGKAVRPDDLEEIAEWLFPCTQEVVERTVAELKATNIHLLDPHNRGFKPGALNAAFRQIQAAGLLEKPAETFFLIIDSDSLVPRHGLRAVAEEVGRIGLPAPIMQMASMPTANFFSGDWYSRFIGLADAIGAVGKWARSTRRLIKPDLHAGSGVVVPAPIALYISEHRGAPWTETTLTEDARLIVGQFGLMNAARNRTRMAPSYLLEAVPEERGFWGTYRSFWNQRRRWTTGGYDEFFYMARAPYWILSAVWDAERSRWYDAGPARGFAAATMRARQVLRTVTWAWDHFWWGIGGAIVFTHWWLISTTLAAPSSAIAILGTAMLLAAPLVFIVLVGRHVSAFIPGGLGVRTVAVLYPLSFFCIWLYALPVVATQVACLTGFRARFLEWKPTRKPRYDFRIAPPKSKPNLHQIDDDSRAGRRAAG
jgi:cellulose synthase/poly-beta-1,6-N-acetylglucosamine synthase-like glycosyltransferase